MSADQSRAPPLLRFIVAVTTATPFTTVNQVIAHRMIIDGPLVRLISSTACDGKILANCVAFTSARQTGYLAFTANQSRASKKLLSCIYYVRCSVPCGEKLVCNHSRCLQSCWEEINLQFMLAVSYSSK